MAAAGTLVQMTSHGGGAASFDGREHLQVQPGKPNGRVIGEAMRRGGYDIGQLQERPAHLLAVFRLRWCAEVQRIQRADGGFEVALRQMQITAGGFQVSVAQQQLNGTQIGAGFEQMRGERVAPMPLPGLCRILTWQPLFMGF